MKKTLYILFLVLIVGCNSDQGMSVQPPDYGKYGTSEAEYLTVEADLNSSDEIKTCKALEKIIKNRKSAALHYETILKINQESESEKVKRLVSLLLR